MDERLERFMDAAHRVKDSYPDVRALCTAEKKAIQRDYSTDDSRRVRLTRYRNRLRDAGLTRYFLKQLRLPKARAHALRVQYKMQVNTLDSHQQPIRDSRALIDKALWCLSSRYYSVMLNGLALVSGRRPVELCVTGDFDATDGSLPAGHIWFSGQAKTRNAERADSAYVIPLLCDPHVFCEAFARFHTLKDFTPYDAMVHGPEAALKFKQYGTIFGDAYQHHFASLMPPKTTVRNLRDAYGLIAYATCRSADSNIAISLYLRNILGHDQALGETAMSYQKFYLAEFPPPQWEL
jgi:telomere resolvase